MARPSVSLVCGFLKPAPQCWRSRGCWTERPPLPRRSPQGDPSRQRSLHIRGASNPPRPRRGTGEGDSVGPKDHGKRESKGPRSALVMLCWVTATKGANEGRAAKAFRTSRTSTNISTRDSSIATGICTRTSAASRDKTCRSAVRAALASACSVRRRRSWGCSCRPYHWGKPLLRIISVLPSGEDPSWRARGLSGNPTLGGGHKPDRGMVDNNMCGGGGGGWCTSVRSSRASSKADLAGAAALGNSTLPSARRVTRSPGS